MIRATYRVDMEFLCNDAKVLEELLLALYTMAGMYTMEHRYTSDIQHLVTIDMVDNYDAATKMHYKMKTLLEVYSKTGLIMYPLI